LEGGVGNLPLDHTERRRARLKASLESGDQVGLALPKGAVLSDGTVLATSSGEWCVVKAKREAVSIARGRDVIQLIRVAYHLGNRHVAVQLAPGVLIYLYDPGIDALCLSLGLSVERGLIAFEPEKLAEHVHDSDYPVDSSQQSQRLRWSQRGGNVSG
jgi:urease accessory protein